VSELSDAIERGLKFLDAAGSSVARAPLTAKYEHDQLVRSERVKLTGTDTDTLIDLHHAIVGIGSVPNPGKRHFGDVERALSKLHKLGTLEKLKQAIAKSKAAADAAAEASRPSWLPDFGNLANVSRN